MEKTVVAGTKKEKLIPVRHPFLRVVGCILLGLLWMASVVLFALASWYRATFNMTFDDLLFTLLSPLGGTGESTVGQILSAVLPETISDRWMNHTGEEKEEDNP